MDPKLEWRPVEGTGTSAEAERQPPSFGLGIAQCSALVGTVRGERLF